MKRDATEGAEEVERRWRGNRPRMDLERHKSQQRRGMWPGPRGPVWGRESVMGGSFLPHFQLCHRPPGIVPKNASHPLPSAPPWPPRPPQGSERWRKTGKPTKIFQIRQTCGADKSRAGWDEVSVAPQWGGPVKRGLWPQKNASSPTLSGAHCLSYPQKEPTLGVPTVRDLGISLWPPGHPHGPA